MFPGRSFPDFVTQRDAEVATFNVQPSTFNLQRPTFNLQPSTPISSIATASPIVPQSNALIWLNSILKK
jgi:hypothetical protein